MGPFVFLEDNFAGDEEIDDIEESVDGGVEGELCGICEWTNLMEHGNDERRGALA